MDPNYWNSNYWMRIKEAIQNNHEDRAFINSTRGRMPELLHQNKPTLDQALLVEAQTGEERAALHQWAENNGFKSIAICVDFFPDVYGWKCKECNVVFYNKEISSTTDWSMDGSRCFGSIIRCDYCDSIYSTDDPYDPDSDDIEPIPKLMNGVAIGRDVTFLKQMLVKHRRKRTKKHPRDKQFSDMSDDEESYYNKRVLNQMPLRDVKLIDEPK
jgi:hypothetical protein